MNERRPSKMRWLSRSLVAAGVATAASALLLGSVWSLKGRIGSPGFGIQGIVLLTIAGVSFCMTFFVAARIAYVVGRVKKVPWRSAGE